MLRLFLPFSTIFAIGPCPEPPSSLNRSPRHFPFHFHAPLPSLADVAPFTLISDF